MIIVSGTFVTGIEVDGTHHKAFTLRAGKVRDSVEALEELGPDASGSRLRYATLARRLTVDGIDLVTTDMVLDLSDEDGLVLEHKSEELEKNSSGLKSD